VSGSGERSVTATVAVRVAVPPAVAFAVFTEQIDEWWRRGPKFRHAGMHAGQIAIECRRDGRVYERWDDGGAEREFELGRVLRWEPPHRFAFSCRNATFAPVERTEVEVEFAAQGSGTLVTVRHRGWEALRQDHPARHGMADDALARSVGLWWGDQLTSLREFAAAQ